MLRRGRARVAVGADVIGAKRVDGDEHDVGLGALRPVGQAAAAPPPAARPSVTAVGGARGEAPGDGAQQPAPSPPSARARRNRNPWLRAQLDPSPHGDGRDRQRGRGQSPATVARMRPRTARRWRPGETPAASRPPSRASAVEPGVKPAQQPAVGDQRARRQQHERRERLAQNGRARVAPTASANRPRALLRDQRARVQSRNGASARRPPCPGDGRARRETEPAPRDTFAACVAR